MKTKSETGVWMHQGRKRNRARGGGVGEVQVGAVVAPPPPQVVLFSHSLTVGWGWWPKIAVHSVQPYARLGAGVDVFERPGRTS